MSQNPYSSPQEQVGATAPIAINKAFIPGVILIVLGSIWLLFAIASIPINLMQQRGMEGFPGDNPVNEAERIGQIAGFIIGTVIHFIAGIVAIVGGIAMVRAKGYRTAMVAAVTACIPCLTPCILIGIPFGIWAIIALVAPETKAAFAKEQTKENWKPMDR